MITHRFKPLSLLLAIALVVTLGIGAFRPQTAFTAGPTTLTLLLLDDPHLLVDSNNPASGPHVTTAYATITNTGVATAYDVYAYIGNGITPGTFNTGSDGNRLAMLSGPTYATRYIGNLAPGESKTVYWMLTYPLTYGQTYPMTIWASNAAGCFVQASHTYTTQSTINSQADRILGTVTMNPPSGVVSVGNILTVTVTGFNLGTLGTYGDTWFQPVGNIDFSPACFRLVRSEVYIHSIANRCGYGPMPYVDRLYFPGIRTCYAYDPTDYVKYYFVALQECTTTVKVYQEASSGSVEKYSADYGKAAATLTGTSQGGSITLAKSVSPLSGGANTLFTWTITYTDNTDYPVGDPQSGNGLVLIDEAVPNYTTYVAGSATCSGSCIIYYSTDNGATWTTTEPVPASSVDKLKWYINQPILAHGSGAVSFQSRVNSGVPGEPLICNSASCRIDDGASMAADSVCANGGVDLELSKVVDKPSPCEDSDITYTITVSNPSAAGATNVQATDLLPTGVTYYSSVPSQGSYDYVTGLWTVGSVNAGASATLLLTATVNGGTGSQTITNTANITHVDQTDPVMINNSAHADILVLSKLVAVADSNTPVCAGDTIQLYGGPSGMSYSWTGPLGFTSNLQRPTISSATLGMSGTYTLTVTAANGCSDTTSTYVTVQTCATPPDTPTNISPSSGSCVSLPVTLTASPFSDPGPGEYQIAAHWQIRASTGGYSYPVFDSATDMVNLTSITIPAGILSESSSYCWHVRYQGNLGAWSEYSSETCFYTKPIATASSNSPVCHKTAIQLFGGPDGMDSYHWVGPPGSGFDEYGQNQVILPDESGNLTPELAGNYTLTVTDTNGCSDSVIINVDMNLECECPPAQPVNLSPGNESCVQLPVQLVSSEFVAAEEPGGIPDDWLEGTEWQVRELGQGYATPVYDLVTGNVTSITVPPGILSPGTAYYWHVKHQDNEGAWSIYSNETCFYTKPVATASSNSPVCEGGTIELAGGPSGMSTYSWAGPGGFTSDAQSVSRPDATLSMGGDYILSVTDVNGCSSTATTTVVVNAKSVATASSNSPLSVGDPIQLYGGPSGMNSYSWTGPLGFSSSSQNPTIDSAALGMTGVYALTVTNANGCSEVVYAYVQVDVTEAVPPSGYPMVTTLAATNITANSVTLNMYHTLGNFSSVQVRFVYALYCRCFSTPWESVTTNDNYAVLITGLHNYNRYAYKAQLKYDDTVIDGATLQFIPTATWSVQPGGGCFIATAAYGTPIAPQIQVLRDFRDQYLLTNPVGEALVDLYYRVSPPIAEFITEHPSLKPLVRAGSVPAVAMSTVVVNTTVGEKIAILGFVVLVSAVVVTWMTRRRGTSPDHS